MIARIILEDGTIFEGEAFGANKTVCGELVFNTSMTGYQEILTDPSYAGQMVVMTYPLIGNYGINPVDIESDRVQVNALVVKEFAETPSHYQSEQSLNEYLIENEIPGISGIDTRMLTKKIRNSGVLRCMVTHEEPSDALLNELKQFVFPANIVELVSNKEIRHFQGAGKRIGIVDLGLKKGILKQLLNLDCEVTIFPHNIDAQSILDHHLDAILFSNGPGDPKDAKAAIEAAKSLMGKMPIWGICLGHQILALALGADTYKLKFGHRGANHPVICLQTNKVFMSSQNHGYAVCEDSIHENLEVTFMNVNDQTIEGIRALHVPIVSVQFHPEEGPGPCDGHYLFKEWLDGLEQREGQEGDLNAKR